MKLGKAKSPIIPVGDFEKVRSEDEEKSFYENPLIPWWSKAARAVGPERKQTRTKTWCKRCGRKHSKREACNLHKYEDLTVPPIQDEDGEIVRTHKRVGHYSTRDV